MKYCFVFNLMTYSAIRHLHIKTRSIFVKSLLVTLTVLFSLNLFAGEPVLTENEEKKVVNYLDYICADTFCGGDINYYPKSLKCDESSCTLKMDAVEYFGNYFDMARINQKIGQQFVIKGYIAKLQSTFMTESWDIDAEEERMLNAASFSCQINGLQKSDQSLDEKIERFYDYVTRVCVPMIEALL